MTLIAHLGPIGTNAEAAALAYAEHFKLQQGFTPRLKAYPTNIQALQAVAQNKADLAVVPVENSIEGSVTSVLDTIWQLDTLQIQHATELPITHALFSMSAQLQGIERVYSHPQALSQCQMWLNQNLPNTQAIATNSTAEALTHLDPAGEVGAIASPRAAQLHQLPILAHPINDHPSNCTRFWVVGSSVSEQGSHTSFAFSTANIPGALVKPLQVFAIREINMSRIESRPTKRCFGTYIFFVDIEASLRQETVQAAFEELKSCVEHLKIFGSYTVLN
ncbi:MAG: prephenate dehydratase [Microcoleaceae cyanobacterium]